MPNRNYDIGIYVNPGVPNTQIRVTTTDATGVKHVRTIIGNGEGTGEFGYGQGEYWFEILNVPAPLTMDKVEYFNGSKWVTTAPTGSASPNTEVELIGSENNGLSFAGTKLNIT